jgi:hypothetical protein
VGGGWDRFALDNGATGALSENVLGQSLFASIEGEEVRALLRALIERVRTSGRPAKKMYRCNSPSELRLYTMTLTPLAGGALQVMHEPAEITLLNRVVPFEYHLRPTSASVPRCSFCNRFLQGSQWMDAAELPLLRVPLMVVNDVCDVCRQDLQLVESQP